MEKTVFVQVFGESPAIKVLDFFLDNPMYDFSKSEIARESGISRVTLEPVLERLTSLGIVKQTRKSGRSMMYKIDRKNELAKKLIRLDLELSGVDLGVKASSQ